VVRPAGGDGLLEDLRAVVGAEHAWPATDEDAVAEVPAACVAAPGSTDETAEVMRAAARHGARVVVRGGRTKLDWGAPPEAVDLVVDTGRLAGVVEHAAGDLVVTARAGTPLEVLDEHVATHGQMLALDSPLPGTTVGGTVSVSTSGPRRLQYGTVRDLLIGVTVVRADGTVARSGGKVVKNVAGYDLGKLYTGAYGTLGVVTEATFRLHPSPPGHALVTAMVDSSDAAWRRVRDVLHSPVSPTAVELDRAVPGSPLTLGVLVEGVPVGVEARAAEVVSLLGGDAEVSHTLPGGWGVYPFAPHEIGIRLTTPLSGLPRLLDAADRAADRTGLEVALRGSAGVGVLHAGVAGDVSADTLAALLASLRGDVTALDGTVVVLRAPSALARAVDMWGPVRGLDLMRRVKEQFDPEHRLAPGRFVGGI